MTSFSKVFAGLSRRKALIAFACCAVTLPAIAQQPLKTLLVGVDHRSVLPFNGDWHYLVDQPPGESSLHTRRQGPRQLLRPQYPSKYRCGPHNDEYDFATAPTLKVPGDWNTQDPISSATKASSGISATSTSSPNPNTRTFLHIGAANYKSHVWVNQKRICDHEGGFTLRSTAKSPPCLHAGTNFVVIAVDSTRLSTAFPPSASTGSTTAASPATSRSSPCPTQLHRRLRCPSCHERSSTPRNTNSPATFTS